MNNMSNPASTAPKRSGIIETDQHHGTVYHRSIWFRIMISSYISWAIIALCGISITKVIYDMRNEKESYIDHMQSIAILILLVITQFQSLGDDERSKQLKCYDIQIDALNKHVCALAEQIKAQNDIILLINERKYKTGYLTGRINPMRDSDGDEIISEMTSK